MRLNTYVLFIFQQLVSMFIFKHDSRIAYCLSLFLLIWNDFKITFSLFINFKTDLKRSLTVYHVNELKAYHQTAPWLSNWHHVYVLQWNALTIDFFFLSDKTVCQKGPHYYFINYTSIRWRPLFSGIRQSYIKLCIHY